MLGTTWGWVTLLLPLCAYSVCLDPSGSRAASTVTEDLQPGLSGISCLSSLRHVLCGFQRILVQGSGLFSALQEDQILLNLGCARRFVYQRVPCHGQLGCCHGKEMHRLKSGPARANDDHLSTTFGLFALLAKLSNAASLLPAYLTRLISPLSWGDESQQWRSHFSLTCFSQRQSHTSGIYCHCASTFTLRGPGSPSLPYMWLICSGGVNYDIFRLLLH